MQCYTCVAVSRRGGVAHCWFGVKYTVRIRIQYKGDIHVTVYLIAPRNTRRSLPFGKGLFPPLGLMCLAAYTPENIEVRIIDENVQPIDFTDVPHLVGITTLTATAARAYEIADRYRALGTKVVLGGVHASMVPEEALAHADSVVIGEAETTWPRVVADAEAGRLEPVYRQTNFVSFDQPRSPRVDLIDSARYWSPDIIQTARGCPHNCSFCSVTAFNGRRHRAREVDSVLAEVQSLSWRNPLRRRIIPFVDDNIAAKPKRAKELFAALKPLKVIWGSQACITFANDEELVALAAESGCRLLLIGLETLSAEAIAEIGKRQNRVEQYEDGLQRLRKYGIHVVGAFVFGFDSDDESVFSDTLDFAIRSRLSLAQFSALVPYPGTRLYERFLEEGRVEPKFWLDPSWTGRVVYEPRKMSAKRLYERTKWVQRAFYSYGSMARRFAADQQWYYWLGLNLAYHRAVSVRS